jgi:hypothetical protein
MTIVVAQIDPGQTTPHDLSDRPVRSDGDGSRPAGAVVGCA